MVRGGGTPRRSVPSYYGGGIPWVTPKDMKRPVIGSSEITLTSDGVKNSPAKIIPPSAVLVVVRSGVLKHTLPIARTSQPVAINQDMKALIPTRRIEAAYLARLLKALQPRVLTWVRATTADNFPIDKLLDLEITLPPIAEQRRIAAILDHADALRAKRRQVLAHLDALTQSIFHHMFGGIRQHLRLDALVREFRYGTSNKSGDAGYPTLRIPNIVGGVLDTKELKTVKVTQQELDRLRLIDGDLLFVRSNGNPENVGRAAVFDSRAVHDLGWRDADWIYASYLIRARPAENQQPTFLASYLASPSGRRQLRERSKTSAGQYNINIAGLGSIEIPAAPIQLQREFARRLHAVAIPRNGTLVAQSAENELFASLQSRAFRGEL